MVELSITKYSDKVYAVFYNGHNIKLNKSLVPKTTELLYECLKYITKDI